MGLLKNIEWTSTSSDLIVYKYPINGKDQVNKGSAITVRESQVAIFLYKGKLADVFLPGYYKLDTDNMPILTRLMSWKYGFETPFKADIFFVNTKQFTNLKWGTSNPILVRDADYGTVRVRGFGSYSFRVDDAYVFMQNLSGTEALYDTTQIEDYLRSIVVRGITDTIGESKIPVLDMAANLDELSEIVAKKLNQDFKEIGLKLSKLIFESFSLPEELEKMIDKNAGYGVLRKNLDVYTQVETIEAMKEVAKNGGGANAGVGLGMGVGLGNMFANNMQNNTGNVAQCPSCGASVGKNSKFCPECGTNLKPKCAKCGTDLKAGTKFCPECGEKVGSK
ncbi:MAG: zinc-ribbon domain-containing protein [Erysipelotrichaceae bacterium]|nr:zinc-ribbon domain-containing protein [Erysipelotrichaceae bacterium]